MPKHLFRGSTDFTEDIFKIPQTSKHFSAMLVRTIHVSTGNNVRMVSGFIFSNTIYFYNAGQNIVAKTSNCIFLYIYNIDSSLYCHNFTVSTFSGGLHLCTSCDSDSCFYTNTIFQENQEELGTNCICRNKALIPF